MHEAGGHEEGEVGAAVFIVEELEADADGVAACVLEVDEGAHEIFPGAGEGEEADGDEGGLGKGHEDSPPDAEGGAAVDHGGFVEGAREGHVELAEEEDVEGAPTEEGREDEGEEGVDEAEVFPDEEDGDHGDLAGEEHGGDEDGEEDFFAGEIEAGEAVGDEGGGEDGADDAELGDDDGVEDVEGEGVIADGEGFDEVLPVPGLGRGDGRLGELAVGFEGGEERPEERGEEDEREGDDEGVEEEGEEGIGVARLGHGGSITWGIGYWVFGIGPVVWGRGGARGTFLLRGGGA